MSHSRRSHREAPRIHQMSTSLIQEVQTPRRCLTVLPWRVFRRRSPWWVHHSPGTLPPWILSKMTICLTFSKRSQACRNKRGHPGLFVNICLPTTYLTSSKLFWQMVFICLLLQLKIWHAIDRNHCSCTTASKATQFCFFSMSQIMKDFRGITQRIYRPRVV